MSARLHLTNCGKLLTCWLSIYVVSPCGLALGAESFQLPLEVQEPAGVERTAWPVSGGVPLPKGLVAKWQPDLFSLFRSDGKEIPCQTVPLVVEPNGQVNWILVDFQDDFAAGATNRYVLRLRKPAARADSPLRLTEQDRKSVV